MTGEQALTNFTQAAILVIAGKYDEARAVEMLPSDRSVIEAKIAEHIRRGAKTAKNT